MWLQYESKVNKCYSDLRIICFAQCSMRQTLNTKDVDTDSVTQNEIQHFI